MGLSDAIIGLTSTSSLEGLVVRVAYGVNSFCCWKQLGGLGGQCNGSSIRTCHGLCCLFREFTLNISRYLADLTQGGP
jgi:hypothetical protein